LPPIDWGQATTIILVGLAVVASVLVGLALVTWIAGIVIRRTERKAED